MTTSRAVIVGAGIAGVSAAGGLRAAGFDGEILLISDEQELPYRRPPLSKEVARGDKGADDIRIKPAAWYTDQKVELVTGVRVDSIDPNARSVRLSDGRDLGYTQLLLATGGTARTFGLTDGSDASVITLRSMADIPRVHERLVAGQHVVIVGAGLIGSEIAASARSLNCDVTLLETASQPLPRLLPPALAELYVDLHKSNGTELHTDVTVEAIRTAGGETVVTAADGRTWTADTVVLAVGMQPSTELAEAAGLAIDNGIVVDERGETSVPGIFAAGDVANLPSALAGRRHRVEHWQHAMNHGTAVGKAMAGADTTFDEVPWCWSDQYGTNLQVTGWPEAGHDVHIRGALDMRNFCAFFVDRGVLVGAIGMGRPNDIRTARKLIASKSVVVAEALSDDAIDLTEAVQS
jgi:NADPH-dependent 2,4-dienoyl-CoA reductase/sulfur reductase-like enzyme